MTDEVQAAEEAAPEVVQTEVEQTEAPEAADSTEGQVETPPAEGETPEDKISASKARRERRKAEMARLKAETQEYQAEIARLQGELERRKNAERTPPPQIEDFSDHDEYVAALSAYKAAELMDNRQLAELEREAQERQSKAEELAQRQVQEARENWAAQADEARTRYADFDAVVTAPDVPITENMATLLGMSDVGADVAYYLGTHKEQARALAQMPVPELMGAMRMLEQFVSVQTPRPRTQTQAPDPVKPVKPKATAAKKVEEMSMAEYMAARKAGKI